MAESSTHVHETKEMEARPINALVSKADAEKRQKKEEARASAIAIMAQETSFSALARETINELIEMSLQLRELRLWAMQNCRKMTLEEKKQLTTRLSELTPEDLHKALEMVAEDNPSFQYQTDEVDLDLDAQSQITLWRLKFFVQDALERDSRNKSNNNTSAT